MSPPSIDPALQRLVDRVQTARAAHAQLDIRGGGSKRFYGEVPSGEPLDVGELRGISSYDPSELVVSVRAGTPLAELEDTLAAQGQCLPFEPPHFGVGGTVGGMIAAGLAGPARATVGGVRDYLLGATMLNGRAEVLSFGGQVIKNVAGYDLSRVLAGSMGILGVICEVSLKVLPILPATLTLRFDMAQTQALDALNRWAGQPLPLSASAWHNDVLVLRLAGASAAVQSAAVQLGGQALDEATAAALWAGLRDHRDEFFMPPAPAPTLWRLSLPSTTAPLALPGATLIEWGGAQRWLWSDAPAATIREAADRAGGHAVLFRGADKSAGVWAPLTLSIGRIHHALKAAFDPDRVFNPGRLYPDL
jgi:glycolate oxidase FAD binding subunit